MERGYSSPADGMANRRGIVAETGGLEPPHMGVKGPRLNHLAMSPYSRRASTSDLPFVHCSASAPIAGFRRVLHPTPYGTACARHGCYSTEALMLSRDGGTDWV